MVWKGFYFLSFLFLLFFLLFLLLFFSSASPSSFSSSSSFLLSVLLSFGRLLPAVPTSEHQHLNRDCMT